MVEETASAAEPLEAAEERAWADLRAAWQDEEAHRAYLARFADLVGLAVAGRRYREALAADPDDAVAARWRDEVLKRAMVQGLASLPRRRASLPSAPGWLKGLVLAAGVVSLLGWAALVLWRMLRAVPGAHP
jgi:hypothetical protein